MCLNRKLDENNPRTELLARIAHQKLMGEGLEKIAIKEDMTVAEVVSAINEIEKINPELYKRLHM